MTDQQRIHPVAVDVGAPPTPTRPLVRMIKSDQPFQNRQGQAITAMPHKRSCWCKCLCWTVGLLILLLVIIGATAGVIYLIFQPKLPQYSVDNLRISDLTLNFDLSLYARFSVRITANNPNKKIGIYYERGSHLSVWYKNTNLCQGSLPTFYQGHRNTTMLSVGLSGQNQYGRTLLDALQEEQMTGRIPLDLKIDVPVKIKLGKLKLTKVRILGSCRLIVDRLSTNSFIRIQASTCNFGVKL
ncbi:Late embryogenesis abundant (LEA) hydroxyproline-rich glycoprotein family [Striga hermonthica]|uniref:Late embryogenesis abundant (LEA) hydroxyproline-rich glycoprotein family n=1 Tax=Striga hermonthica TaxID=68872 RepID=A0A9N7MYN8_STRHE|nr:Late embryogenesis abundant (LEA) hydroxyproline-rich glycoprotein family [Striga hermonthica]